MKCKYKKFLKAAYINYDEDYCSYGSSTFTKPTITTPIIVIMGTTAIIACAISGVTIYYTLDGSTPTSSSTLYTGTITLTLSCVIKAIAVKPGMSDSEVASENYVHYLTAWRLVGNSVVHTDEYLTQWKVSGNSQIQQYLTQWKVEGNSVVDNNTILSCGDLGQDGKYHVKISNGVDVFDISLDEPLRKVNDIADIIEFANGVGTVTRNFASRNLGDFTWVRKTTNISSLYRYSTPSNVELLPNCKVIDNLGIALCPKYSVIVPSSTYTRNEGIGYYNSNNLANGQIFIYDSNANTLSEDDFKDYIQNVELIYQTTPTTETIQSPQIAVSSTNTYSSANDTPYSAFTYANPLIYSCGDYSDVDGKYHVKISNGVTIYDIPLTEPLRKVNDVADSIEFANGVATLTRLLKNVVIGNTTVVISSTSTSGMWRWALKVAAKPSTTNLLSAKYPYNSRTYYCSEGINVSSEGFIMIFDNAYTSADDVAAFKAANADVEIIYELAIPITEVIQVSPFPVSATDTYTSANDTPYSAFEYKKNVEIWSCGEYSAVDGKYHILVQPLGGNIADIALDEPLRKVNDVADIIEFANGVATLTRNLAKALLSDVTWSKTSSSSGKYRYATSGFTRLDKPIKRATSNTSPANILCPIYSTVAANLAYFTNQTGIAVESNMGQVYVYDENYNQEDDFDAFKAHIQGVELIYESATPTTETIQVPQIEEADSYTCVISQGGKAVSWSGFETE